MVPLTCTGTYSSTYTPDPLTGVTFGTDDPSGNELESTRGKDPLRETGPPIRSVPRRRGGDTVLPRSTCLVDSTVGGFTG